MLDVKCRTGFTGFAVCSKRTENIPESLLRTPDLPAEVLPGLSFQHPYPECEPHFLHSPLQTAFRSIHGRSCMHSSAASDGAVHTDKAQSEKQPQRISILSTVPP